MLFDRLVLRGMALLLIVSLLGIAPAGAQGELPEVEVDAAGGVGGVAVDPPVSGWSDVVEGPVGEENLSVPTELSVGARSTTGGLVGVSAVDSGGDDVGVQVVREPRDVGGILGRGFVVGGPVGRSLVDQDGTEAVSVEFDLEALRVANTGDLASRLEAVGCRNWLCLDPVVLESRVDGDRGVLEVEVPSSFVGRGVIVPRAAASGSSGSYTASPLEVLSEYQVGLSTGSAETGYSFVLPAGNAMKSPELSLSYSSGSIDQMASYKNNQPGIVGAGWSLNEASITRHFVPCDRAGSRAFAERCTAYDAEAGLIVEYSIVLNGVSSRLIPVGSIGRGREDQAFVLENDPGWRVTRKFFDVGANFAMFSDRRGEYWEVVDTSGVVYQFGLGEYVPTVDSDGVSRSHNSIAGTWIFNNPRWCETAVTDRSRCLVGWKWGLDKVRDPYGNQISYFYESEVNSYDSYNLNSNNFRFVYDRSSRVTRIEYNYVDGQPLARVMLDYGGRCVSGPCVANPSEADASAYPDVPLDLRCDGTGTCKSGATAQTFWTSLRLDRVRSEVRNELGSWEASTLYQLNYSFTEKSGNSVVDPVPDVGNAALESAFVRSERKMVLASVQRLRPVASADQRARRARPVTRVAGQNRILTAITVSQLYWTQADTVVVASAYSYPDALAGGALAASLDAPLLLVDRDVLAGEVRDEIHRLGADHIVILGGGAVVSTMVETQLRGLGSVERVSGSGRVETAAAIRQRVLDTGARNRPVAIVGSRATADALAAGSLAGVEVPVPTLMTESDGLPNATWDALVADPPSEIAVVGGLERCLRLSLPN